MYEDALLTWNSFGCDDVRAIVRESFNEWQYNSRLLFEEVGGADEAAAVTVVVEHISIPSTIATATRYPERAIITLDRAECWYTDRAFCASVRDNLVLVWFLLGLAWFLSVSLSVYLVCRPQSRIGTICRIANWAVFVSCPILAFSALLPCTYCFDLKRTIVHEVGHVIGFRHTDEGQQMCGCNSSSAVACDISPDDSRRSVMHSIIHRSTSSCLTRNDADGLRTHYGAALCNEAVRCYDRTSFTGHSRVAVAIVYGFLISWLVVSIRRRLRDCMQRKKSTSTPAVEPVQRQVALVARVRRPRPLAHPQPRPLVHPHSRRPGRMVYVA